MISARARQALLALVAILVALGLASPAEAKAKPRPSWETFTTGVVVFGDSMTVNARRYLPSTWRVDAQWGRGVTRLPERVNLWNGSHEYPRVAVIALGTNAQAGWSRARYEQVVARFPRETRIVFVTTWRADDQATSGTYSSWMRQIARTRPGTQIADWRTAAAADPALYSDVDHVHQTEPGRKVWSRLVREAVNRAAAYKPRRR